jgi:hypothetical protein
VPKGTNTGYTFPVFLILHAAGHFVNKKLVNLHPNLPRESENMLVNSRLYQSYILRLWRESAEGEWRSSLQNVTSGDVKNFGSLSDLFMFICTKTEQPPFQTLLNGETDTINIR